GVQAGVAQRIERAEHRLVGRETQQPAQLGPRDAGGQHALDRRADIAERVIGTAPAVGDDVVEPLVAGKHIDYVGPEMAQELVSCRHTLLPFPSRSGPVPPMSRTTGRIATLAPPVARRMWLRCQRLDAPAPFGSGPGATRAAVQHLGYVQIDTI